MKKIFLTGDASQDWLIFSETYLPPKGNVGGVRNWENNRQAQMHKLPGGVLLLNSFLKKLKPETKIILDSYLKSGKTISGDSIQTIAEVSNLSNNPDSIHVNNFLGYSVKKGRRFLFFFLFLIFRVQLVPNFSKCHDGPLPFFDVSPAV